jgi:hypothetical protein
MNRKAGQLKEELSLLEEKVKMRYEELMTLYKNFNDKSDLTKDVDSYVDVYNSKGISVEGLLIAIDDEGSVILRISGTGEEEVFEFNAIVNLEFKLSVVELLEEFIEYKGKEDRRLVQVYNAFGGVVGLYLCPKSLSDVNISNIFKDSNDFESLKDKYNIEREYIETEVYI